MKFDLPKDQSSIIKVIGVGGGGSNAVNHMFQQGIKGVDFIVCNTDHQALDISPVPVKVQLGASLTEGRGAGSIPDVGMNAAIENLDEIKEILANSTKMVFVTAGMGGGTGTGAAPVIAKLAKEMGILTVGIVTVPFMFEGRKRRTQAEDGIERMRNAVDTLLIINNDKLREMYGNLTLANAFSNADDVLSTAAKGIADVISVTGQINVDFNDVSTVMRDSGVAIMGSAQAEGENRAHTAVSKALSSPLLNDNDIKGAKYVLLNITYGEKEVLMDEIMEITDFIQDEAGSTADVIWGHAKDEELGEQLSVTIIATGFNVSPDTGLPQKQPEKVRMNLEDEQPTMITAPIQSPVQGNVPTQTNEPVAEVNEPYVIKREESELKAPVETPEPFIKNEAVEIEVAQQAPEVVEPINEVKEEEASPLVSEQHNDNIVWDFGTTSNDTPEEPKTTETLSNDGKVRYFLEDDLDDNSSNEYTENIGEQNVTPELSNGRIEETPSVEDNIELAKQRIERIRQNSQKLKTVSGLTEMENEPAYRRRQIRLDDVPHSSESNVSRFTLGDVQDEDGNNRTGLSDNNSFLHDNVD
ncbi:MAG: cell division protein FtsZ [Flavobacteriales bacterium]|nr:cell division protein FtsZ [Flavobacteriales bacterium]